MPPILFPLWTDLFIGLGFAMAVCFTLYACVGMLKAAVKLITKDEAD
jgi:hypothetical protein